MASISVENDIHKVVWRDRTVVRSRTDRTVRRIGREWVTVEPTKAPLTDWRRPSSNVTHH